MKTQANVPNVLWPSEICQAAVAEKNPCPNVVSWSKCLQLLCHQSQLRPGRHVLVVHQNHPAKYGKVISFSGVVLYKYSNHIWSYYCVNATSPSQHFKWQRHQWISAGSVTSRFMVLRQSPASHRHWLGRMRNPVFYWLVENGIVQFMNDDTPQYTKGSNG